MERRDCDALVLFGATGDLCYRKIFPALYHLVRACAAERAGDRRRAPRRDARAAGSHGCATASRRSCRRRTRRWSTRLIGLLRYVDGDYNERATFDALRQALDAAQRPLHYLAIPPSMFPVVIEHLSGSGSAPGRAHRGREALRPRPRLGARAQSDAARAFPGMRASSASITTSARRRCRTCCTSASPTPFSSRCGTATSSPACRSPWPRRSASPGAGASTRRPAPSAT